MRRRAMRGPIPRRATGRIIPKRPWQMKWLRPGLVCKLFVVACWWFRKPHGLKKVKLCTMSIYELEKSHPPGTLATPFYCFSSHKPDARRLDLIWWLENGLFSIQATSRNWTAKWWIALRLVTTQVGNRRCGFGWIPRGSTCLLCASVTPGAARLRDQLCAAQLDDEASVLQANVEFYVA